MPHQKRFLFAVWVGLIGTISALGREFPLQQVARPDCKSMMRDQMSEECKISVTEAKTNQEFSLLLFSALRGSSYDTPQVPKSGGHPSLDMPTAAGTPVYAIHDGIVTDATEKNGYGQSISIKHTVNGEVVYSSYSHLSEMLVKKGDIVKSGQKIGKVGCSGFSISGDPTRCGNHLDFQISTEASPSHPYGYGDCPDGYMNAVQQGLCKDKLEKYTIDPLVFFNTHANITFALPMIQGDTKIVKNTTHSAAPTTQKSKLKDLFARLRAQNQAVLEKVVSKKPTTVTSTTKDTATTISTDTSLATRISIPEVAQSPANSVTFNGYTIGRERNMDPMHLVSNKVITLTLTIYDTLGNPISGYLPTQISIKTDNFANGSFFPDRFTSVNEGKKHIFFQSTQPGTATISLWRGSVKINEQSIEVK